MRTAVVGCGRMGAQPSSRLEGQIPAGWLPISHAEALLGLEGAQLVALCDTVPEQLERAGKHFGVSALFVDYRQLIDEMKPEILTVATRTPAKKAILEYAFGRGVRGIYVEKPLANNLADCESLLTGAENAGVKLAYGVNRRYHAVYRLAKEMINNGEIGEVVETVIENGRSPLLWTHPHSVDLILFFAQNTDVVSAQASLADSTVHRKSELLIDSDPVVEGASFQFASGATGVIGRSGGLNVRVAGNKGSLMVGADGSYIQLRRQTGTSAYHLEEKTVLPLPARSATVTALAELLASVAGAPAPIAPNVISLGLRMLLGCTWSHLNQGQKIDLRDVPSTLTVTGRFGDLFA